jgi:hypothetical protein
MSKTVSGRLTEHSIILYREMKGTSKMNNSEFVAYLESIDACADSIDWVGTKSSQEAWDSCSRFGWMEFLLDECDVELPADYYAMMDSIEVDYQAKVMPIWATYCDDLRASDVDIYWIRTSKLEAEYRVRVASLIRSFVPACPV